MSPGKGTRSELGGIRVWLQVLDEGPFLGFWSRLRLLLNFCRLRELPSDIEIRSNALLWKGNWVSANEELCVQCLFRNQQHLSYFLNKSVAHSLHFRGLAPFNHIFSAARNL